MDNYMQTAETAMIILFAWGALSIIAGVGLALRFKKQPIRDFWLMNAVWGVVDSLLAGTTLLSLSTATITSDYIARQTSIVGFNIFLDAVYVTIGYILTRRKAKGHSQRQKMFGYAIMIQGSFLFVFDLVLWLTLRA